MGGEILLLGMARVFSTTGAEAMTKQRAYWECDGDGWFNGVRYLHHPRTFYVITQDGERIDCDSLMEARAIVKLLNKEPKPCQKT